MSICDHSPNIHFNQVSYRVIKSSTKTKWLKKHASAVWDSAARFASSIFLTLVFFLLPNRVHARPHCPLAQTVGAPSKAWRFLQGESPCRTRPNQPFVPSVAVMKENAKTGLRYTVERENLGVEAGTTTTSTSLETGTQISAVSGRTTSLKRTQGTTQATRKTVLPEVLR